MVVGGAALAREQSGRVVFISGALPGETVDVRLRNAKKDFANADVVTVVVGSPDRVEPSCSSWHRGCGGCDWQHIAPDAQLRLKTEIVREALRRTARIADPVVTAAGSVAAWHYRTTIRLAADSEGRFGFRSRRSHDIVAIENCPVADQRINELLAAGFVDNIAPDSELIVRAGDAGPAVVASPTSGQSSGTVHVHVAGHRFRVSSGSFFQSSPEAAELLVAAVGRACSAIDMPAATVVDAYSGVGLFAATVAREARAVIMVESSASSCGDAVVNLTGSSARVVESRIEDWQPERADLVIADPARNGLDKIGARVLAATGAPLLVLVSCDVGSLARDCTLLQQHGYAHQGTEVFDVFPNTSHIEAVSAFVMVPVVQPNETSASE